MAALIRFGRKLRYAILGVLLIAAPPLASASAGLIGSSRVTGDDSAANVEIRFNCKVEYLRHEPEGPSDSLRVFVEPTSICNGVSPLVAQSRGRYRPINADSAQLVDLEYDGSSAAGPMLTLNFSEPVSFDIDSARVSFELFVQVSPAAAGRERPTAAPTSDHRQVIRAREATPDYVINLASMQRVPTAADALELRPRANQRLYYSIASVNGTTWYRLRLGDFSSAADATNALAGLQEKFPGAWIDEVDKDSDAVDLDIAHTTATAPAEPVAASKVDELMTEARQAMVAGETSRAIQIYTKVLQLPENSRQPEAQEFLALAREKNGQLAHAKAEYQRYLSLYPNSEGALRVGQRLAALLANGRQAGNSQDMPGSATNGPAGIWSDWRVQTYFSQYYRRDANQQNDQDEIISQSALYSDVNLDARRRGQRFDFSSRLSAGYRNDFLREGTGSGDDLRVSYAYADLSDARTGLRGRVGRQSRNTGGVLGRFDGLNLGYQAGERVLLSAVIGKPAYSASDGIDSSRTFRGASVNYGPVFDNLELGLYVIQQDIEGMDDRQAVGAELRYFGESQSVWGLVDYDTLYDELGSAFLQASWRFGSRLTLHGSFDRRHSPFLSTGNALIGQPVVDFAQLTEFYPEDDIRQFGLDRSPISTTYTIGVSHSLTPKLQINADANQSMVDATPASGGVAATPESEYRYFSTTLVASSLLKEGDVSIIGIRYSDSDTTRVTSLTIDSRYPFGRTWRVNPRLRIDRRQGTTDSNSEWLYTPGIRVQYRRSQKFRVELEAGKQFSERDTAIANLDRESYFVNFGYQVFF